MKNRHQLRQEFAEYGIDFIYNIRSRQIFLKIQGAPQFVEGLPDNLNGAMLTGWYSPPGGIKDVQDVAALAQKAKDLYRKHFANNPQMLQYVDAVEHLRGQNCLAFVNEGRLEDGLPALKQADMSLASNKKEGEKPPLSDRINAVKAQQGAPDSTQGPAIVAPER